MRALIALGLVLMASTAEAYVGPGLGIGVLGAIFGALVTVFLAVLGIVWYPIKRLLKKRKPVAATRPEPAAAIGERPTLDGRDA